MKLCARANVTASHVDENGATVIDAMDILDISVVWGRHPAGWDDGGYLHIQAPPECSALEIFVASAEEGIDGP